MTTVKQDKDFLEQVIGTQVLESAVEWIKDNMNPEDIFEEKELMSWASDFDPDVIFKAKTLETWAENNGYIKE